MDIRPRDHRGHFIKKAIPAAVRRGIAERHGAAPEQSTPAECHYCGAPGTIWWRGSWVYFDGLEIDHVEPEFHGGATVLSNLVLACRTCNRRKGARRA